MKHVAALFAFVCLAGLGLAQAPPPPPANTQLNLQTLAEMLRTAQSFNELVRNMNLKAKLGPDVHTLGADGLPEHSPQRTAATIGAGAGVGAAIGGMTRAKNVVLLGAVIGTAGGLIIDEIVKQREKSRAAAEQYVPEQAPPMQFRQRTQ